MRHATNLRELFVQLEMGCEIGRGPKFTVDDFPIEIRNDNVPGRQLIVRNAAGLDGDQSLVTIHSADIAEGIEDEAAPDEFEIRFQHLFAERFQQHVGDVTDSKNLRSGGKRASP
jgi:hypothetical protein